mmetsp:Transcript_5617/g.12775  ORF Transcript_5617/g.12775 Transcript_5617/m.12775 type:complete len:245 (-) Transcript_5617:3142-3876(-)
MARIQGARTKWRDRNCPPSGGIARVGRTRRRSNVKWSAGRTNGTRHGWPSTRSSHGEGHGSSSRRSTIWSAHGTGWWRHDAWRWHGTRGRTRGHDVRWSSSSGNDEGTGRSRTGYETRSLSRRSGRRNDEGSSTSRIDGAGQGTSTPTRLGRWSWRHCSRSTRHVRNARPATTSKYATHRPSILLHAGSQTTSPRPITPLVKHGLFFVGSTATNSTTGRNRRSCRRSNPRHALHRTHHGIQTTH